jgi:hypothetical protein
MENDALNAAPKWNKETSLLDFTMAAAISK